MNYVLGFAFDFNKSNVLLIEKQKPEWQKGLLNGVGGKVEPKDKGNLYAAMSREFKEEVGLTVLKEEWDYVGKMFSVEEDWAVHIFTHSSDYILNFMQTETEKPFLVSVRNLDNCNTISNIPWLVKMCLDKDISTTYFNIDYIRK